jgi:hypothetical protein
MASFPVLQSLIDTVQGGLLLVEPDSGHILAANQLAAILLATPCAINRPACMVSAGW